MKTILSRVKLNTKHIVWLLIFMLAAAVAEMMLPTMLANMIDSRIGENSRSLIFTIVVIMAVLALVSCVANVIAHRLSTIKDADMILYMENGDIKEAGNHDSLMELNGKYAVLYNSQFA